MTASSDSISGVKVLLPSHYTELVREEYGSIRFVDRSNTDAGAGIGMVYYSGVMGKCGYPLATGDFASCVKMVYGGGGWRVGGVMDRGMMLR